MGVLRTLVVTALATWIAAPEARADTDLTGVMAGCVGRYSAELEHAWLMKDPRSVTLERQRAGFLSILDAIMPAGAGQHIMHQRIEAKHAQARLLTAAEFSTRPAKAAWARRQARLYAEICAEMLLDS